MLPLLATLALTTSAAPAQERRLDAHAGGRVALASTAFEWTAEEARAFVGERKGARVVLRVAKDAGDPLAKHALPAREFLLEPEHRLVGDDAAAVAAIAEAAAIELVGGTWTLWWKLLLRDGKTARIALELDEAHRRGVPIVGTGAAAGFLAWIGPVDRAELDREEKNLHRPDPTSPFAGLGLVETMFDAESLAGPSVERELRALLRTGLTSAVFVLGDGAWIVDEKTDTEHFVGREGAAAFVLDVSRARRMRESLREGRISLLEPGQRWDQKRRRTLDDPDWRRSAERSIEPAEGGPLAAARLSAALARRSAFERIEVTTPELVLRLWADEDSEGGSERPWTRIAFDVQWEFREPWK